MATKTRKPQEYVRLLVTVPQRQYESAGFIRRAVRAGLAPHSLGDLYGRRISVRPAPDVHIAARTALQLYVDTIHSVEQRCMAADGPVTPTCREITDDELRKAYVAAVNALKVLPA